MKEIKGYKIVVVGQSGCYNMASLYQLVSFLRSHGEGEQRLVESSFDLDSYSLDFQRRLEVLWEQCQPPHIGDDTVLNESGFHLWVGSIFSEKYSNFYLRNEVEIEIFPSGIEPGDKFMGRLLACPGHTRTMPWLPVKLVRIVRQDIGWQFSCMRDVARCKLSF